ncbi:radical SAM protein, partial [Candidatus Parcubacteria bacterium]|nr:radical SAM protein [Candidatus Parcubacteria bacterium]
DIIEAMSLPKIDRYLHLPVQSGDDEILKKMNRPYTVEEYLVLVEKIRGRIPDIEIGTDLIVGFPGETTARFENTVKLCKKIGFVKAYVARYSPRPGTAAFKLKDDISPDEKRCRWRVLENLVNQNR